MPSLDDKLSEHFTLGEFLRSETAARRGIDNTPVPEILSALVYTADRLEDVRRLMGVPLYVSSGYRCLTLNRAIGSKDSSAHTRGLAIDFDAPAYGSPLNICRAIYASTIAYDQLIYEHTWVHIAWALQGTAPRRSTLTLMPGGRYTTGLIAKGEA